MGGFSAATETSGGTLGGVRTGKGSGWTALTRIREGTKFLVNVDFN